MPPARFFHRDPHAPSPNRPIGVGALTLIERDDALLLELRADCERWGVPGGAVESDEDLEDALRREVLEETGLVATDCELSGVFTDSSRIVAYSDGNVVRLLSFVYRVEVRDFETLTTSEESLELRFFDVDALRDLDVVETALPIIEAYLATGKVTPFME